MMKYSMILTLAILQCVYFGSASLVCSVPRFSCQYNNPCDPLCVADQYVYPGKSDRVYVECVEGTCAEQQCPSRTIWNQASQRCERNGLEARCSYGKFDCEDRNPCAPTLCEAGVENYPGPSPRRYVSCAEGCVETLCPRRKVWDQEEQRCVPKPTVDPACPEGQIFDEATQQCVEIDVPVVCGWQEISVPSPVDDCANEYTFYKTRYHKSESGNRYLDGFLDCEAASEGNQYYVEDFDIAVGDEIMFNCFKSDGLCLTLTASSQGDDGWYYFVFNIFGPTVRDTSFNATYVDFDNQVSPYCNEMEYFDEPGADESPAWYEQCYNNGGSLLYGRVVTNYGSCSAKIPCGLTTSEDVKVHEYVCA